MTNMDARALKPPSIIWRVNLCLALCTATMAIACAATAETQDARVTHLLEQANQRAASGESSELVEQWLTRALQDIGMATTPPDWDVYAQARWKAKKDGADDADSTKASPSQQPAFVVTAIHDDTPMVPDGAIPGGTQPPESATPADPPRSIAAATPGPAE
jgi:hypothetical protein